MAARQRFGWCWFFMDLQSCYMILNIVSAGNAIFSRDQAILLVGWVWVVIFQGKGCVPGLLSESRIPAGFTDYADYLIC